MRDGRSKAIPRRERCHVMGEVATRQRLETTDSVSQTEDQSEATDDEAETVS